MPTRSEVRLYTLGVRLRQAMIVTRSVAAQRATFVHAVVTQLLAAIDDLGPATPFSAPELQALQEFKKPCRTLLRRILRSEEDDLLEAAYEDFSRSSQLILHTLEPSADVLDTDPGRRWLKLGLEIVNGWDDELSPSSDYGDDPDDDEQEEQEEDVVPESDAPDGDDQVDDDDHDDDHEVGEEKDREEGGDKPDRSAEQVANSKPAGVADNAPPATSEELKWHWKNGDSVRRLLESLGVSEGSVFPEAGIDLAQARWMCDLPTFVNSWDRIEVGLQRYVGTAVDTPQTGGKKETGQSHGSAPSEPPAGGDLSPCQQRIVDVIRAAGERMTLMKILSALESEDNSPSESMTRQNLAWMRKAKILTNRSDTKPRGYGLPEWS